MIYLIAAMSALAGVLLVLGLAGLLTAKRETVVSRRLEEIRATRVGKESHPSQWHTTKARIEEALRALGQRFVASRSNIEALRTTLVQAGYRDPKALPIYFAARTLGMFALALIAMVAIAILADSVAAGVLSMPYFVLVAWLVPRVWLQRRVASRQADLQRALPDTLDLLVVCVEAGLGLNQAMDRVAREIGHVSQLMSSELRLLNLEIRAGTSRDEAFRHLGERTGSDDLRSLASMLIQADRFGTSVAQALRVQAETLRTKRRQRAEEAAAKTTIKLVFPLVLFIFPALFVIILGPAVLSIMDQMSAMQ